MAINPNNDSHGAIISKVAPSSDRGESRCMGLKMAFVAFFELRVFDSSTQRYVLCWHPVISYVGQVRCDGLGAY